MSFALRSFSIFCLLAISIICSCGGALDASDKTRTYEDYLAETAAEAADLAINNRKFELDRFINGRWRGKCHPDPDSSSEIEFDNGRAVLTSYHPSLEHGSAFESGLYEIVNETEIKLLRLSIDSVEIQKLNENSFRIAENGTSMIYYGCIFTR